MKMNEVRKKARKLGIRVQHPRKADLIRMIQRAEGNFDCFGSANGSCDQVTCCFRDDCLAPEGR